MGVPRPPEPATLIVGLITGRPRLFDQAEKELTSLYGPVDVRSPVMDFDATNYYEREMGPNLKRRFLSFKQTIDPGSLADIKLRTNSLEETLAGRQESVSRSINIDPGYVCSTRLVLASTKDTTHRIYVGKGIYAEITLVYRKGKFEPVEWPYPDYRSEGYLDFFTHVRHRHMERLKEND
ncbi:MAG: DUF4416 family protein [Fidelibacterota bacterium]